ncbi:MAG: response regulator [Gemmatimonadales bacterium]|nr:response regulator [Gemmatimonadales bacterium]
MHQRDATQRVGRAGPSSESGPLSGVPFITDVPPGMGGRVRGPLLTVAIAILFDQLTRHALPITYPFIVLLASVVYAGWSGGLRPALVSSLVTLVYATHYLKLPGVGFHYTPGNAYTLVVLCAVVPCVAVLVGRLNEAERAARKGELQREEALELARRSSFLSETSRLLASSLDYTANLRGLARLTVPELADWCTIHVVRGDNSFELVGAAHRDPARELMVQALGAGGRGTPFPVNGRAIVAELHEDSFRQLSSDAQRLQLYRALLPKSYIALPLIARNRTIGVITLVAAESRRPFGADDLAFAEDLGARVTLALENALLDGERHEAEQRADMLFKGHPLPMWVFDAETLGIVAVNQAASRHYGYTEAEFTSMTIIDLRAPDDLPGVLSGLERAGLARGGTALAQHQRKDGSVTDMELVSHEFFLEGRRARLVLATDVSERTRTRAALAQTEDQLRQAQRIAMSGRLAGGIAHDFNNLLTTIRGFSDLVLRDVPHDASFRKDIERIMRAADRGALVTRQLMAFGRPRPASPRAMDVNGAVTGMEGLARRIIGADVQLVTRLGSDLGRILLDPGYFEQILMNLLLNASDAMPSGGTLTIETGERQIARSAPGRTVRPGRYVVLAVSDTGAGMDAERVARLFEPYQGEQQARRNGLGLSTVHGIVRQAGGVIRISSEPGDGTTVKVYLPRIEDDESPSMVAGTAEPGRGTETVLVVEDEDGVREVVRAVLIEHGYTVLEARHGRDALLVADQFDATIHLLVTDVVMPEMGGGELATRLLALRPGLKVLYISGYTVDEIVQRGVEKAEAAFVHKPFTPTDLIRKVRGVLGEAIAPGAEDF